eukprot:7125953-Karenia_brevis.AAC.1
MQGWRGPAEIIKIYRESGKAVVTWRGMPLLVPCRHVRPHIGFTWLFFKDFVGAVAEDAIVVVFDRMNLVEDHVNGQIFTYGKLWNVQENQFYWAPADLQSRPPEVYVKAKHAAEKVLDMPSFD